MTGKALHIHPEIINMSTVIRMKGIGESRWKTRLRMSRVKEYRYKKAGREWKEVYHEITWKSYITHSLSTLE